MKKIYLSWVLLVYLLAGCAGNTTTHEHDHEHESHELSEHEHSEHEEHEEAHQHGDEISFKKTNAEAIGLQTQVMKPAPFTEVIKTSGRIIAAQGSESTIVATVPGVVTLGKLPFIDGTAVSKGQTILSLASNALSEGDVAARAKHNYENAKKEYERMSQLVDDRIVSRKDFEQARLNYENAKVAYDAIAGKQTAKGVAITAPISGYLKNILVKEGDYVTVGQPLATLSQNNRLQLRADVSEKYYSILPLIRSAHFKTPYDDQVYKLDDLHGRMVGYGKAADDVSFYIPVTFEFDNRGNIIPGSFVDIYLLTRPVEQALTLPISALIEEQGLYFVYLHVHEEAYKKQEVKLGFNDGERVQILSGLHEGDEVVTTGAYQIKLASASNAIPAHTHHH